MTSSRVLLIGWDAADWKVSRPLMDAGKMPNLRRLVSNGVSGPIATLHPPLSPMLWTSIATGKRPFKHGIHGFSEPAPDGSGVRPVTNLSRTAKALWNIFSQNHLRSIVIGWWPSHPAEPIDGVMVSDRYHRAFAPLDDGWPLPANSIHPAELADTLAALRTHPDCLTPQLVERFIPRAREIDQDKDTRLAAVLRTLAECMSIQSAAIWLLENEPWDFFAVYYEALDHFCHSFMRYHPPRQSWIAERDFELYHNVVAITYQLHDEMLGALLKKAGDDTTVVLLSDHGFHPDHLRPASIPDIPAGPAIEHRDFGMLCISGPGVKKGDELHGASVLDIAPTVLTLYGLPVGEDMDGKVLSQAFVNSPEIAWIASWEDASGRDGRRERVDTVAAHEVLEQMIALGYIERPNENRQTAMKTTTREQLYNLAESYQDAGRHAEAWKILSALHRDNPHEQRFAVRLFVSCQALGMHQEMRRIIDDASQYEPAVVHYLTAQLAIQEKRSADALAIVEQVPHAPPVQMADLYLRLRRHSDARRVYDNVLASDPDNTHAHLGLCRIALFRREYEVAANWALEALRRRHHDPRAHFLLGRALAGMKQYESAADAFRAAISLNSNFAEAHLRLAALLDTHLGDKESAREHRRLARAMRVSEPLTIVTGLPRSGTSVVMQMLAAAGFPILTDNVRAPDENNPRGYFEFERVKNLLHDSQWLFEARGRAVKIIAPLLLAVPPELPCRVILCDRDLDEVLDSQGRMLSSTSTPERRRSLRDEYARIVDRIKARPSAQLLVIEHRAIISDPVGAAAKINHFLGGKLDTAKMAAVIDPALYRNRRSTGFSL